MAALSASSGRLGRRRPTALLSWVTAVTAIVCLVLFFWPVAMIAIGAFRTGEPGESGDWTIAPLVDVLGSPEIHDVIRTSGAMAILVTLLGKMLAFYFAWLVARTNTPLRRLISPTMLVVLAVPPLFFGISWSLLGNERVGLVNRVFQFVTGTDATPVNIQSFAGMVFVTILKSTAFGYFLLIGPMYAMSRRMEEAAAVSGARRLRTFWTVNVPVLGPALAASMVLGFISALEYFEVPLILGRPAGVQVFSTKIFEFLNDEVPPQFAQASVLALMILVVLVVLLLAQKMFFGRREFKTVTGKSENSAPWDLGRWKYVGMAAFGLFALLAVVLPAVQILLTSVQPYLGSTKGYTLRNYRVLFDDPQVSSAIRNTLLLAVISGFLVMALALAIVFVTKYSSPKIGVLISKSTWLPWAMPGPAMALGLLWILLSFPLISGLYGSFAAMIIALVVVAIPVAMRNIEPAVGQIGDELEEAAWIAGSDRAKSFATIILPLIVPSFMSGWLLTGILISGNLTMPLLIGSPTMPSVPKMTYDLYNSGSATVAAALCCTFLGAILAVAAVAMVIRKLAERGKEKRRRTLSAAIAGESETKPEPSLTYSS